MKNLTFLLVFLLCGVYSVCAQSKRKLEKSMDADMGLTRHQLILKYGPPSNVSDDGADGEILIFSQVIIRPSTTAYTGADGSFQTKPGPTRQYYLHRMYYINKDKIVYSWRWERNAIPPQQLNVNANISVTR